ncbi:hypothetical protein D3C79_695740 [compost metagenome]
MVQRGGLRIHLDHGQVVQALIGDCQVAILQHGDAFRVVPAVEGDLAQYIAIQAQFDQDRVLAHDCEQGAGTRVEGHVRSFIVVHARQRLGIDVDLVVRQPYAFAALGGAFEAFLDPQRAAVIPVHGHGHAIANYRRRGQAKGPAQKETTLGGCRGAGGRWHAGVLGKWA